MRSKQAGWYYAVLHLSAFALAAVVVLVSVENRRLEAQLREATAVEVGIEMGGALPEVLVDDLEGRESRLGFATSAESSVFLVFSPACESCSDNLPQWQELYEKYGDHSRVIGVSLQGPEVTRAYAETNQLDFPIVIPRDTAGFIEAYGVTRVPMTLVTDSQGRALNARIGPLPRTYSRNVERWVTKS